MRMRSFRPREGMASVGSRREVFELIWYQDLTHADAAAVLGVATKTIQRRWREARLQLHHLLDDDRV